MLRHLITVCLVPHICPGLPLNEECRAVVLILRPPRPPREVCFFSWCVDCTHNTISHNCADSFLPNSAASEQTGAAKPFEQNSTITQAIERGVLALTITEKTVRKSQRVFIS